MQRYFVDTFYRIDISNPSDQGHRRAMAFSQSLVDYYLYTVDGVLAEYLTFFSTARPHVREQAAMTVQNLLNDSTMTVIPKSRTSFETALAFYASRPDKHYSHTDCVSMLAMRREGLTEILTNDHHFNQEGCHILFD